jgi:hypothetical protein
MHSTGKGKRGGGGRRGKTFLKDWGKALALLLSLTPEDVRTRDAFDLFRKVCPKTRKLENYIFVVL